MVWSYVAAEMWRLILLTSGVLLCVTAFGVSVKYLADGRLGALDCLRIMFLMMPPMLHYVLPFAACFGATLAYHRLAADNEALACHAGGISHRGLVFPAMASGLVLTVALLFLSSSIIPRFLEKVALVVSQDAPRLIVASIQRKEAVKLDNTWIYADAVAEQGPDEKNNAFQRLWLGNVMFVNMGGDGEVRDQGSAHEAYVWLMRVTGDRQGPAGAAEEPFTQVVIQPRKYVSTARSVSGSGESVFLKYNISTQFTDDPKFLTSAQLRSLRDTPERISAVEKRRRALALALAQRETFEFIRSRLQSAGAVELTDGTDRFTLRGSDLRPRPRLRAAEDGDTDDARRWYSVEPAQRAGDVTVDILQPNGVTRRRTARSLWLDIAPSDQPGQDITITLEYINVSAEDLEAADRREGGIGAIDRSRESGLVLADGPGVEVMNETSHNLIRAAESRIAERPADAALIAPPLQSLRNRIDDLMNEVLSKRHERMAMSAACIVMVVLGAVMALRLRDSLPLVIYLWAFFPALGAVLTVSAGQQLTHEHGLPGLILMWGGVAGLAGYTLLEFTRLSRH